MALTVADMLVERLIGWGVNTIFGLPGDGINGIFEALRTRQDKSVSCRSDMRKLRHLRPARMPSLLDVLASASPRQGQAACI